MAVVAAGNFSSCSKKVSDRIQIHKRKAEYVTWIQRATGVLEVPATITPFDEDFVLSPGVTGRELPCIIRHYKIGDWDGFLSINTTIAVGPLFEPLAVDRQTVTFVALPASAPYPSPLPGENGNLRHVYFGKTLHVDEAKELLRKMVSGQSFKEMGETAHRTGNVVRGALVDADRFKNLRSGVSPTPPPTGWEIPRKGP